MCVISIDQPSILAVAGNDILQQPVMLVDSRHAGHALRQPHQCCCKLLSGQLLFSSRLVGMVKQFVQ